MFGAQRSKIGKARAEHALTPQNRPSRRRERPIASTDFAQRIARIQLQFNTPRQHERKGAEFCA